MTGTFPSLRSIGGHNTWEDIGIGAGAVALGGLGLGALGTFAPAAAGAADVAAAGAPLDLLAGGAAAGTATPAAIGDIAGTGLGTGLDITAGADATSLGIPASLAGGDALPGASTVAGFGPSTATPWSQGGLGPAGGPPPVGGAAAPGAAGVGGGAAPAGAGPLDLTTIGPGSATPAAGAPAAAPAAAPAGSTNLLGQLGNFLGSPTGKGLQAVLGAGTLGYDLYSQNQTAKADAASITNLQNQANSQAAAANAAAAPVLQQGQLLTSYLTSGTLPAPIQAQLDQATAAAKAGIIANAGARGVSTDPTQNSALAADLAAADQQALATKGTLESQMQQAGTQMIQQANSLIATGLKATQMDSQLQEYLLSLDNQLSQQTGQAISNFAAALGGGRNITAGKSGSITING
jgi:hypothetical protein